MRTTKPKPSLAFPARFNTKPEAEPDFAPPPKPAQTADAVPYKPTSRKHYRRSPFYLKIEGLTGERPKYDEFGRLVAED